MPEPNTTTTAESRRPSRIGFVYRMIRGFVLGVTLLIVLSFTILMARQSSDPGNRLWVLNHTPDQLIVINPFDGQIEKKYLVADGLKELAFSRDYAKAYIANMVDVVNKVTVLDTKTYLTDDTLEVEGIPQGIGVFPDNHRIAVITGSQTSFEAGGFDVLDLSETSKADPTRKKRLWRVRDLRLSHKIAIGDDGDRIYLVDAKASLIYIYSLAQRQLVNELDLHGAIEELYYPPEGDYYYASVLMHDSIYQIDKATDTINAVFIYDFRDLSLPFSRNRLRHMAIDSRAEYLYATNYEQATVAYWRLGDPDYAVGWQDVPYNPQDSGTYRFQLTHYLPVKRFRLKGGYDPSLMYTPGGQQIAVDPSNDYLYVIDDEGGVYVFDIEDIRRAPELSIVEPRDLIVLGREVEVRDMKVSRPAVRSRIKDGAETVNLRRQPDQPATPAGDASAPAVEPDKAEVEQAEAIAAPAMGGTP